MATVTNTTTPAQILNATPRPTLACPIGAQQHQVLSTVYRNQQRLFLQSQKSSIVEKLWEGCVRYHAARLITVTNGKIVTATDHYMLRPVQTATKQTVNVCLFNKKKVTRQPVRKTVHCATILLNMVFVCFSRLKLVS